MRNFAPANFHDKGLDLNRIASLAPSVMASHASTKVSGRYSFISSFDIMKSLMDAGWEVSRVQESRTRIEAKRGFTKHMVRFRKPENVNNFQIGGLIPEIVMINDHSGAAAYQFMAGVFRLVCSNGLIVADAMVGKFRIAHKGDILENVHRSVEAIQRNTPALVERVEEMKRFMLTPQERVYYATRVAMDKWGEDVNQIPFHPAKLLTARRYADRAASTDLFTTMNIVQENMIRGGIEYIVPAHQAQDDAGNVVYVPPTRRHTRAVRAINTDTDINVSAWQRAVEAAEKRAW